MQALFVSYLGFSAGSPKPPLIFLMLPYFYFYFYWQALRMQPPLIFLMREVLEDREYKGMTIPKGDKVFLSPSLAGRRYETLSY